MTSRRKLFLQTHVCESVNGHIKSLKVNISVFVVLLCMFILWVLVEIVQSGVE
jgi:hypothetical protein